MRILFFNDTFPPNNFGGAGTVAFNLASGLKKAGNEVFVATSGATKEYQINGLSVFSFDISSGGRVAVYNKTAINSAMTLIRDLELDVVHLHNIHSRFSYGLIVEIKNSFPSMPCFITVHDTMPIAF